MAQKQFKLNADAFELTFHHISQYLQNNEWWDSEKKRLKAIKIYKKLKLEKLFNLAKKDFKKYSSKIRESLNIWCKQCINNTQWKTLKESIQQAQKHRKYQLNASGEISPQVSIATPSTEKTISISATAYDLLYKTAANEKKSISELIITRFKDQNITARKKSVQSVKVMEAIKNTQPDEKELKSHEKSSLKNTNGRQKGKQKVIELWHYAGGQCQALSKVTRKRCKRITPDLSHKHQIINKLDYEYAVCHTHDKNTSQLDLSVINTKS